MSSLIGAELISRACKVIDEAFVAGAEVMLPMFSGGHDSLTAVYAASAHARFDGRVYHIRTGIGSKATYGFVQDICREYGWNLQTFQSKDTYEKFVRERGFPGPGMHQWAYIRLKERCVRMVCNMHTRDIPVKRRGYEGSTRTIKRNVALITGCRKQESERRMGTVEPLKIGEAGKKRVRDPRLWFPSHWRPQRRRAAEWVCLECFQMNESRTQCFSCKQSRFGPLADFDHEVPTLTNKYRFWVAPCHDFSTADQVAFMDAFDLPRNPIKMTPIGMSGECFCGAFARPNEIALIRQHAPDVAEEIDRLAVIAKECGKHCVWGTRPDRRKGVVVAQTGPLCNSCDARAMAAGIIVDQRGCVAAPEA
jgi:3'-phosphoadenosine 5'-phosphosulfate sulfotransferase (PAPS reductase)/FAD synthetase